LNFLKKTEAPILRVTEPPKPLFKIHGLIPTLEPVKVKEHIKMSLEVSKMAETVNIQPNSYPLLPIAIHSTPITNTNISIPSNIPKLVPITILPKTPSNTTVVATNSSPSLSTIDSNNATVAVNFQQNLPPKNTFKSLFDTLRPEKQNPPTQVLEKPVESFSTKMTSESIPELKILFNNVNPSDNSINNRENTVMLIDDEIQYNKPMSSQEQQLQSETKADMECTTSNDSNIDIPVEHDEFCVKLQEINTCLTRKLEDLKELQVNLMILTNRTIMLDNPILKDKIEQIKKEFDLV